MRMTLEMVVLLARGFYNDAASRLFEEEGWSCETRSREKGVEFTIQRPIKLVKDIRPWWKKTYFGVPPEQITVEFHGVLRGFGGPNGCAEVGDDEFAHLVYMERPRLISFTVLDGYQIGEGNLKRFQNLVYDTESKIRASRMLHQATMVLNNTKNPGGRLGALRLIDRAMKQLAPYGFERPYGYNK